MVKPEDRLSYGELCYTVEDTFRKFNGWINPSFKASRFIFDDNNDTVLAMALGNIIIIFPKNILKFYYEVMNVDFTKKQVKSFITFLIVHELSHLEQDLLWYEKEFKDNETVQTMVEGSNNANTYNYLLAARNQGLIDKDLTLLFPVYIGAYCIEYKELKNDTIYRQYLNSYYRIPSTMHKVIYCISILCMDYDKLNEILDRYLNVSIRYDILGNFVFEEIIKINGMYIHPDMIMNNVVNRIVLNVYTGFNTAFYSHVYVGEKNKDFVVIKIVNTEKPALKDVAIRISK